MSDVPQQRSWFSRNWIWVVPVGCLLPVGGCVVIFGGLAWFGFSMAKDSPYMPSLVAVSTNEQVRTALGEPIEQVVAPPNEGIMPGKDVNRVDFTYQISGPNGSAKVHVVADRQNVGWDYTTHTVTIDGTNEVIDVPVTSGVFPGIPAPEQPAGGQN
jgi:hypothetical protein